MTARSPAVSAAPAGVAPWQLAQWAVGKRSAAPLRRCRPRVVGLAGMSEVADDAVIGDDARGKAQSGTTRQLQ